MTSVTPESAASHLAPRARHDLQVTLGVSCMVGTRLVQLCLARILERAGSRLVRLVEFHCSKATLLSTKVRVFMGFLPDRIGRDPVWLAV